ncbi:hypothetical protein [Actinoplanes utahensis]|uniref:Uncharacterized protein n=1 Tax=Actinoplanes utahensis TaxID=1869 RepID=A0A0A6UTK7_ACTUT|nr:hypothetical protein [Actinoplanes utahensis]KHD78288.1 hypothetical protein MB27_05450 [Actinoplanes utahensis]GIF28890.1 hypothetical protein Aut01nite_18760 [Actinoplanes utahensis]
MSPNSTVIRELLVRHLQTWATGALQRARRATYVHGYADADDGATAEAALRALAGLPDLARGRELSMVAVGGDVTVVGKRLATAQGDAGAGAGLTVLPVGGGTDERLAVAVRAAGASGVPLLGFLDATAASGPPAVSTVRAVAAGKPAEVLLVLPPGGSPDPYRGLGFPLVTAVETVTGPEPGEVVALATTSAKSLESFKEALWEVGESEGVRLRDPADPERRLIDVSSRPDPEPLRRELLAHLADVRRATVTELRSFALTGTVYRAADASRVLHALVDAGTVTREPAVGRLGGDVVIGL